MRSFDVEIEGSEVRFTLNRLKFRDQEKVVDLIASISEAGKSNQQAKSIREAVAICLGGWSRPEPITDWDLELDFVQAVQLINLCLRGNTANEAERKKSE